MEKSIMWGVIKKINGEHHDYDVDIILNNGVEITAFATWPVKPNLDLLLCYKLYLSLMAFNIKKTNEKILFIKQEGAHIDNNVAVIGQIITRSQSDEHIYILNVGCGKIEIDPAGIEATDNAQYLEKGDYIEASGRLDLIRLEKDDNAVL